MLKSKRIEEDFTHMLWSPAFEELSIEEIIDHLSEKFDMPREVVLATVGKKGKYNEALCSIK